MGARAERFKKFTFIGSIIINIRGSYFQQPLEQSLIETQFFQFVQFSKCLKLLNTIYQGNQGQGQVKYFIFRKSSCLQLYRFLD